MEATVDYCGEIYAVKPESPLVIGREGSLEIDDNPYLHRRFLVISADDELIWLSNVGSQLSATVADVDGLMQAWLAPGARMPIVFARTAVWFSAGPTTYEFEIILTDPRFHAAVANAVEGDGETTIGRMAFTPDQRLLIVALAEPMLRRGQRGAGSIPATSAAAARLGWTVTKFNRKLDNVCDKLTRGGIRGLHGDAGKLASSRRARLVEYALAAQVVTAADLELLDVLG